MPLFSPAVYPVPNRAISLGKEIPGPGSIAAATFTFPMTTFKPVDKYTRLEDSAWRNAMGDLYNLISGVREAELSMGGPFFADGIGYPLLNVFGDYYQGINVGTTSATNQLSGSSVIGAGTIVVTSGAGFTTNAVISIGGTATTACEVRKITNVSGGTLTLNAALYQAHNSANATGTVVAWGNGYNSIQHNFAQLNSGLGAGGSTSAQPPTYTYYDFSGVPATSGARQYGFTRFSELAITSEATKLLMWDGKAQGLASSIPGSTPPITLSTVIPQAAWLSTVTLGGSSTINAAEWKVTFSRKQATFFANAGQQDFIALPVGALNAKFSFNWAPASDELEFLDYLNNSQPTLQLTAANGLAGSLSASLVISANQIGFMTGELNDSKEVFGYDETGGFIENTTNIGPSAGFGPCVVQVNNAVINY